MTKPEQIGRYQIFEEIGRGGYAVVYRALDTASSREVALKVLKTSWSDDPKAIDRFMREAQVVAQLDHPNIVTIHDVGGADGRLYIAMKLLSGRPLNQVVQDDAPLSWDYALALIKQIAEALDYAHARKLVHRDVKPSNIIVSDEGQAVLTDFGTVRATEQATLSTGSTGNAIQGTAEYIPPEVWEGKPATVESDVYALACVMYEMLIGRPLFAGDNTPAVMMQHVLTGPKLPAAWPKGVPATVSSVLTHALARKSDERFATAHDFAVALQACTPVPVKAKPAQRIEPVPVPERTISPDVIAPATIVEVPPQRAKQLDSTAKQPPSAPRSWRGWVVATFVVIAIGIVFAVSRTPTDSPNVPVYVPSEPTTAPPAEQIAVPSNPTDTAEPTLVPTEVPSEVPTTMPTDLPLPTAKPSSTPRPTAIPATVSAPQPVATIQRKPTSTPIPAEPLNVSWYADPICWGAQTQKVTINLTAHGGQPPYTYYNDSALIAQLTNGSATFSVVSAAGNPIPLKLIAIDSAGQRVTENQFYKSGLHCP